MPDQYAVAERQRAALLRGDRQVSRLVLDAYFQAWKTIRADLEVVTGQLAEARARGEEPSAAWLYQEERLSTLSRQVEAEVAQIAARLGPFLTGEQARWVARATEDAAALLGVAAGGAAADRAGTVTGEFVRLNPGAVEGVIGFLSDGSPLQALLNELGPDAAERVGNALTQGVILGQSPAQIARLARRALGGNAARAMLISRDAVIRSYQETTHQNYLANAATVAGWRWWASLGSRACASCVSLHGTLHPLTERLREHPGGRCTQVPVVKGEPEPAFQTGPEWFAEQPVSVQRAIVGPAKLGALQSGDIAPEDLSIRRRSRRWGAHFTEATYAEALASADARRTRGGTA
jgi:hypothetical protein